MTRVNINEILSKSGLKCTKQRISVMKTLSETSAPLTAEDIFEKSEDISISTVYRIVEKLCEKGIVSKKTIQDSDRFYYELVGARHRHYAICLGCGEMKSVSICPMRAPDVNGFTVTGHKLEIYGYCAKCSAKAEK